MHPNGKGPTLTARPRVVPNPRRLAGPLAVVAVLGVALLSIRPSAAQTAPGTSAPTPATSASPAPPSPTTTSSSPATKLTIIPPTATLTVIAPTSASTSAEPAGPPAPAPAMTAIVASGPAPTAPAPPIPATTAAPSAAATPPAPTTFPPAPPAASPPPPRLAQLADAAAARVRDLNAQVTAGEAEVARAQTQMSTAQRQLSARQDHDQQLRTRLAATTAQLQQLQGASSADAHTVAPPATPGAGPGQNASGAKPPSGLARLVREAGPGADKAGSAVVAHDTASARRAADAARRADDLADQAAALQDELTADRPATDAVQATLVAASTDLAARAQVLERLRAQLSAALADVTFGARALGATAASAGVAPSPAALAAIPAAYLDLYQAAAPTCPGLSWTVLGAIGAIESGHGQSPAPGVHAGANVAGAMGPMQFLAPTWAAYGVDGGGDGIRDPYDPADAIYGAANYLCANGAGDPARLAGAIWDYNHADWYVASVLDLSARYGGGGLHPVADTDAAALVANPNLTLAPDAVADLLAGRIDARVLRLLAAVSATHQISVSVLETGHSQFVKGTDRVSDHFYGRAVDITSVDGVPVSRSNDAALALAVALEIGDPSLRPDELGSPWPELSQFPGAFSDLDHLDHLHLGWSINPPELRQVKDSGR